MKRNGSQNTPNTATAASKDASANTGERGAAKVNSEDETNVETNDKTVKPTDVTKNITAKRTTNQEIATHAGLLLRTATKRKERCSSAFNVESRLEYESRNEDLKSQIEEMREISMKSQKMTLDLFRALHCQKAMNELISNASPGEFINTAFMATESINAIASQMSPETGQRLIESGITTTPREAMREFHIPQ